MPQTFILLQPEALSIIISGFGVEYKLLGDFLGRVRTPAKTRKKVNHLLLPKPWRSFINTHGN